ncbi:MAG: chemotaxis protein CheW [Nitrospira sp.]|nr:chemotaxis protein CheW [Nitrospira sp.]
MAASVMEENSAHDQKPTPQDYGRSGTVLGGEDLVQFVICKIGAEEFAVDVLAVQEIIRMVEITQVPKAPVFVEGVINLRGRIIPVLDLRRKFNLAAIGRTAETRIVVVLVKQRMVGLLVDSVEEVIRLNRASIEPPPSLGSSAGAEFTLGIGRVGDRLLILLDLDRLLVPTAAAA